MKKAVTFILSGILTFLIFSSEMSAQNFSYPDAWNKPGFTLQTNDPNFVEINFSVGGFSLEDLTVDGKVMKDISLPGSFLFNNEGAPDLPGNGKLIAIPQGSRPLFEIISSRTEVLHGVEIAPAPRIPKDDENVPLDYIKNEEIYSRNAFYPAEPVVISNAMKIRGVDAVMLGITPFQYNPVTKELMIYRDLKVRITFTGGNGQYRR